LVGERVTPIVWSVEADGELRSFLSVHRAGVVLYLALPRHSELVFFCQLVHSV